MRRSIAFALVHAPVLGKGGETMVSTVTNLDVHDLSRSAKTYGIAPYFVVTPIAAQRELVERICTHWTTGSSAARIPTRKEALALVEPVSSIEDAVTALGGRDRVEIWATAARTMGKPVIPYSQARQRLGTDSAASDVPADSRHVLVLFGTSWGLAASAIEMSDALLAPIESGTGFNHLSVRAAAAIVCDRLLGHRE